MRPFFVFLVLFCIPWIVRADTTSVRGALDPNNPNDVYLYTFALSSSTSVTIQSYGYGGSGNAPGGVNAAGTVIPAGGFDTYFSLFQGTGNAATFVVSNDDGGCSQAAPVNGYCEDSRLVASLTAGNYTLALTLPFNFSFAENYGSGTLGDGFIGLQGDYYDANSGQVRSSNFAFDISGAQSTTPPVTTTPEPASVALLGTGIAFTLAARRRRRELQA